LPVFCEFAGWAGDGLVIKAMGGVRLSIGGPRLAPTIYLPERCAYKSGRLTIRRVLCGLRPHAGE